MKYYARLSIIFCLSCQPNKKKDSNEQNQIEVITLKGEILDLDTANAKLCIPVFSVLIDSFMLIRNRDACEFMFTAVDIKNMKVLKHFMKKGRGPNELSDGHLIKSRKKNCFEFYEGNRLGYYRMNILDMLNQKYPHYEKVAQFKKEGKWDDISTFSKPSPAFNINDTLFITSDYYKNGMLGLCKQNGKLINTYFQYPDNDENNIDPIMKNEVFQYLWSAHPKKDLFVNMYFFSDWLQIYKLDNGRLKEVYSHYSYLPPYTQSHGGLAFSPGKESKIGNISLDTNASSIYVLQSNKNWRSSVSGGALNYSSDQVFVYDWRGNMRKRYRLDQEINQIGVDAPNEYLYGIGDLPYPSIVRYKIQ